MIRVGVQAAYQRIAEDLRSIWGDMALAMLRKRVRDVGADPNALTQPELERIVELLRTKTLPSVLGEDGAEAKARQYLDWVAHSG